METRLTVEGMTCGGCEQSVRAAIMQTQGIAHVTIDRLNNQVRIVFSPSLTDPLAHANALQEIVAHVEAAGFDCRLPDPAS